MQHIQLDEGLERDPALSWGAKMRYYRERAGMKMADAAEIINDIQPTSAMALTRLERMTSAPTIRRQRVVATLALLVYGVHPEPMGLSLDELPSFIDAKRLAQMLRRLRRGGRGGTSSRWTPESIKSAVSSDAA